MATDTWTSRACQSYVSVACKLMDRKFVQHVYHKTCGQIIETSPGKDIRQLLQNIISDWEIPEAMAA